MVSRRLADLAAVVPNCRLVGDGSILIDNVGFDSRLIAPGDLFVALPGTAMDGALFVGDALKRGARAAIVERSATLPIGSSGLVVPSARLALGLISAALAGFPSRSLRVVGVTGTDGKTTTTTLIASILRAAHRAIGVVTTVNAEVGHAQIDTGFHTTTPDAPDLQRYLAEMVRSGATDAVLEVTSHGLAQERVAGCEFDVAVMTNVTGDHLDFHHTFEQYLAAKLRLFESLRSSVRKPGVPKVAVINLDDVSADPIQRIGVDRVISYSLDRSADVQAGSIQLTRAGSVFDVRTPAGPFPITLSLPGRYNVANALAAIAAATALDVPTPAIQTGVEAVSGVPGRFESVDLGQAFAVVVDFAHTPNSLEQVLRLARARFTGRILLVFGCAGLRDRQKRPLMGEVAARLADRVYLTAEDPRTDDLAAITDEVAAGCRSVGRREDVDFWRIPDRGSAIGQAIEDAVPGDAVLITGKGHERSQCFGTVEYPWSDREAAEAALRRRFVTA